MYILGISCFYHDSAAALLRDGEIIAAAQEERFSRKKHDARFPSNAVAWCLASQGLTIRDIDHVVFYEKPLLKFERLLETYLAYAPTGLRQFMLAMPQWVKQKLWIAEVIQKELGYPGDILFCGHHEAHAASAFYPSPFSESAVLTIDGVGEWETTTFGWGKGNRLELPYYLSFPHSLGLLYSAFTYYTGFKVNSGEYKLMGLAPYGEPKYEKTIRDNLIDIKDDGSFKLNMKYFGYCNSLWMTNASFDRLFGGPARTPETKITQREMDIAASIQCVTEEIMLKMARHVHAVTGQESLCLAGGVALNCVANGRILREGPFKRLWIQPASGDAGGALGAALAVWYNCLGNERTVDGKRDCQKGSLLGPGYSADDIQRYLDGNHIPYHRVSPAELPGRVAGLIEEGNVIGWFQGRAEFGPRALGARSIIGDARNPEMQSRMNLKIKYRESFRPFAPTVMADTVADWFELDTESPYMLLVAPVKKDKQITGSGKGAAGFEKLKVVRSQIPAVTHVDCSSRIQTINHTDNPVYYDTIRAFYEKTGCPVIINTSFNVRGEPLVCSPEDAYRCFMRTEMDVLVLGDFLLYKKEQNTIVADNSWMQEYELD